MQMKTDDPVWFAEDGPAFRGQEPSYFNPEDFAWVKPLEAQWTVIRDELQALLAADGAALTPYMNATMASQVGRWKTYGLMFWGQRNRQRAASCPRTMEIVKDIPGLCAVSFNLLEPHSSIKPHYGDTNAIIRCHLGLDIPGDAPRCAFRVRDEVRSWQNGKLLMFCDAHQHTAWNNTDQNRYIMVIDVFRPEFQPRRREVISRVLTAITLDVNYQRWPWLRRFCSQGGRRRLVRSLHHAFFRLAAVTQ